MTELQLNRTMETLGETPDVRGFAAATPLPPWVASELGINPSTGRPLRFTPAPLKPASPSEIAFLLFK